MPKSSPDEKSFVHIYTSYGMDVFDCGWQFFEGFFFFRFNNGVSTKYLLNENNN
jgi:hypothetical protein